MITQGEWRVVDKPSIGLEVVRFDGTEKPLHERTVICHMPWTDGLNPEVEVVLEDNARLIAAAPLLYESLKLVSQFIDSFNLAISQKHTESEVIGMVDGWTDAIATQMNEAFSKADNKT